MHKKSLQQVERFSARSYWYVKEKQVHCMKYGDIYNLLLSMWLTKTFLMVQWIFKNFEIVDHPMKKLSQQYYEPFPNVNKADHRCGLHTKLQSPCSVSHGFRHINWRNNLKQMAIDKFTKLARYTSLMNPMLV